MPITFSTAWIHPQAEEELEQESSQGGGRRKSPPYSTNTAKRELSDENFDTIVAASTSLSRTNTPNSGGDAAAITSVAKHQNGVVSASSRVGKDSDELREDLSSENVEAAQNVVSPVSAWPSVHPPLPEYISSDPSMNAVATPSPPTSSLKRKVSPDMDAALAEASRRRSRWLPAMWGEGREFYTLTSEDVRASLPGEPEEVINKEPEASTSSTRNILNDPEISRPSSRASSHVSEHEEEEQQSFVDTAPTSYNAAPSLLSQSFGQENLELRTSKYRLPLRLPRPENVQSFDCSDLPFSDDLAQVPLQYILDKLRAQGAELLRTITRSAIALPASSTTSIPHWVSVRTPAGEVPPEYAMAITSNETWRTLFLPVHGMVLATNCRALSLLAKPPPQPNPDTVCLAGEGWSGLDPDISIRNLPVVHIHLPSANAFKTLVPYFYSHSAACLLSSLLPLHLQATLDSTTPRSLDTLLSDTPNILAAKLSVLELEVLMKSVNLVHAVWQTAIALGAGRDPLWKVLEFAWAILIGALTIKEGRAA